MSGPTLFPEFGGTFPTDTGYVRPLVVADHVDNHSYSHAHVVYLIVFVSLVVKLFPPVKQAD